MRTRSRGCAIVVDHERRHHLREARDGQRLSGACATGRRRSEVEHDPGPRRPQAEAHVERIVALESHRRRRRGSEPVAAAVVRPATRPGPSRRRRAEHPPSTSGTRHSARTRLLIAGASLSAPSAPKPSSASTISEDDHEHVNPVLDGHPQRQEGEQPDQGERGGRGRAFRAISRRRDAGCRSRSRVLAAREHLDQREPEQEARRCARSTRRPPSPATGWLAS